jgi:hypothetical protein
MRNLCTSGRIKKDSWPLKDGELLSNGFQAKCHESSYF